MNTTMTTIIVVLLAALLLPNAMVSMSTISQRNATDALVSRHIKAGQTALAAGQLERAQTAFQSALKLTPTAKSARLGLTTSHAQRVTTRTESVSRGDAIALSYAIENALADDSSQAELYQMALGVLATALQDLASAQAWFEKATASDSASSKAWAARGGFELSRGELDKAATSLSTAIKGDPKNAQAQLSYGMTLKKQKKYPEAIAALQKATAGLSGPKVWYELGDAHLRNGKFEEAHNAFMSAAKVHPNVNTEPSLLKRLGVTAYRLKKYTDAIGYLTQAAKIDTDLEVLVNLGIAYQGAGDQAAAAQQLAKVVKADPSHAEARAYLMKALVQLNQVDAARKLGRQYLVLAQNRPAMKPGAQLIQNMLTQLSATKTKRPTPTPAKK